MEIIFEKKDSANGVLKIHVDLKDYQSRYDFRIKEATKKVQLKGFRAGHIPLAQIEKMYGKNIKIEEINAMITHMINEYIKSNHINILGDPIPEENEMAKIDWEHQKQFNFVYNLGLAPEFELDISDKIKVNLYQIAANDTQVAETIINLRKQFGTAVDTEIVVKDDVIYAKAKDEEGNIYESILPEYRIMESEKSAFIGAKIGDVVTADIRKVCENEAAIKHVLGIDRNAAPNIAGNFTFTIERISHPNLSELNEEFFKKVFKGFDISTYEAFEAKIKDNVIKSYNDHSKKALYSDLFDYYTQNTTMEFPEEFLKKWLLVVNKGKVSQEQIVIEYPSFELTLKWDLIKNKLALQNRIQVTQEEVIERTRGMVLAQFGMNTEDVLDEAMDKLVTNWVDDLLKKDNGKDFRRYYEELFSEKILDYISSKITLTQVPISIEDFTAKFKNK